MDTMDTFVQRLQANDPRAYEELLERYADKVYRIAYRVLGNPQDAEDATQETFLAVYRNIATFRGDAKFSSWLYRIAYNQAIQILRRRHPRLESLYADDEEEADTVETIPDDITPLPEEVLQARMLETCLQELLMELSPRLRAAFVLHELEGLPLREVAHILNIGESAVKMRIHRARMQLQKRLLERREGQREVVP